MNLILDLGCADNRLGGSWKFKNYDFFKGRVIGLDYIKSKETDIICDLNKGKLPCKDNTFNIVYSHHTFEHITKEALIKLIPEIVRVLKNKGRLLVRVPYVCSVSAFSELTHFSRFGYNTFDCYVINKGKKFAEYDYQIDSQKRFNVMIKKKIIFGTLYSLIGIQFLANKFPNVYESFFGWIFPAKEMHYELEK